MLLQYLRRSHQTHQRITAIGADRGPHFRTTFLQSLVDQKGTPWTLTFEAQSGTLVSGAPALGVRATLGSLVDLDNARLAYKIINGIAYL